MKSVISYRRLLRVACGTLLLCASGIAAGMAQPPGTTYVISSVRPLQLLVTAVAGTAVDSRVLLPTNVDAHHYAPRPSDLRQLRGAAAVFWVGPGYEDGLAGLLQRLPNAVAIATRLPSADGDPHLWTSPAQVEAMVPVIVAALSAAAPEAAPTFRRNAAQLLSDLTLLDAKYASIFGAISLRPVLVYHNAYAPLLAHYGIEAVRSVTGAGHHLAGTRNMAELRQALQNGEIGCVFRDVGEDQSAGMRALLDGIEIQVVELDPLGTTFENHRAGFLAYFEQLVAAFAACRDGSMHDHDAGNMDSTSTP